MEASGRDLRVAHADAWQVLGGLFEGRGGGVRAVRGARLMASGVAAAHWNSGDVFELDADVEAARAFYAALGVPWGLRVPSELGWRHGRLVWQLPLMGLAPGELRAVTAPAELTIAVAAAADLEAMLAVDSEGFGSDPVKTRPWIAALIAAADDEVVVALGRWRGEPVASGYAVHARGEAGASVYLGGITVLPAYRRRGIGAALSSWLVERGFERDAALAHLAADDEHAMALYARLGFAPSPGVDIYVEL